MYVYTYTGMCICVCIYTCMCMCVCTHVCVCMCIYVHCVLSCFYIYIYSANICGASQVVLVVKNPSANAGDAGDPGSIPGSGRSPGEENGNPLQDSCLGNPMDRGAWWTTVHGVAKSQARLKRLSTAYIHSQTYICTHTHTHTHTHTGECCSAMNNEILLFVTTWMGLEGVRLK